MFALRLCAGWLRDFFLTQSLIFIGGQNFQSFCQGCEHFSQHLKGETSGDIFLTTMIEEDNKRPTNVWECLRRKAQDVSALLSLAYEKKKL